MKTRTLYPAPNRGAVPYLALEPELEQRILDDRARGWVNPYRFDDTRIVRRFPNPHDDATLTRPAFSRDIEKILNVPAYNRYAGKTQVFSFVENDDICRRGLHVQLVSRIARNIGNLLGLNIDLIEAIALGHDVGHTPFGHAGEHWLDALFHERTGCYFNHNVHSVRVLDKLYRRNISLQTLDGVLCHNGEFAQQTLYLGETENFEVFDELVSQCVADEQTIGNLKPSTLEGCVVRVSDMIAYLGRDRLDALDMGVIDSLDCFESDVIGVDNGRIINNLTVDIVSNSYGKDHICMSRAVYEDLKRAKAQNFELIYAREGMSDDEEDMAREMLSAVYERTLQDLEAHDEKSLVYRHHIANLLRKSNTLTLEEYLADGPDQVVVDYIASMTDNYFIELYAALFPKDGRRIEKRGYISSLHSDRRREGARCKR